ncbi:3-methylitaconate isomerase [Colletotrichum karsti]|uniref:3-methylitaconate isomerase n=1 Tax=Colletotrichum karsti TaxID=1095194 RepID=A0A9P6IEW2_9PEZI|nr:3-methylitaconate isomerase [Colletotrichum karsti]KAF9881553.1 3-methylitaconate isomerase [Colletotrichum karsti]
MTPVSTLPAPSIFATFIRGGTSKALFFHEKDLPPPGRTRDNVLIRVMGSPDPSQIDGMGGGRVVTSKVAIIRPSQRPDADVDYTFAQVGLGESKVSYDANCGNISSGVGPFAINEGLLKSQTWRDGKRVVRIYNTGTDALLVAHVQIDEFTGRAQEKGDYAISGCQGTGAPILMDYSQAALPSKMLPTDNIIDHYDCTFGQVEATFCEVGNPVAFVAAECLGVLGSETVDSLDSDKELIDRIRETLAASKAPCPIEKRSAKEVVKKLGLIPNEEKGYYVQTFQDPDTNSQNRSLSTAIYYLLEGSVGPSIWHRVDAAEAWHYYAGAPLTLSLSYNDGKPLKNVSLGPDIFAGQQPQYVIPKSQWQRATSHGRWTLVGTTVAPGFVPSGVELADPNWMPNGA